jgi:NADP-dependent alcohol dehydrogenase
MKNFTYFNPTTILFGKGSIAEINTILPLDSKIMILAGGGSIKANGVYSQVREALTGYSVVEFWGIQPNPEYETCLEAIKKVKEYEVDFLLAVGGGSVLDATKFIAAAALYEGKDSWALMGDRSSVKPALPIGVVLTLPATGSEANGNAVISRKETSQKLAVSSLTLWPKFAVLDPETTYSLPERQTINGVVDAFVHVTEQYLTNDVNTPLQDRQAEGILLTLIEEAPKVKADPDNYETRANIMWAATNALNTLIGCGVVQDWATHLIGHEITVLQGLDHARTLAIILPSFLRFQKKHKMVKLAQYGRRVWGLSGTDEMIAEMAIDKTEEFFRKTGIRTKFSEYGIDVKTCLVAAERITSRMGPIGEPGNLDKEAIESILLNSQ